MIQANELRIGNFVKFNAFPLNVRMQIDEIDFEDILGGYFTDIEPIPLTEEWLVRLGAKEIYKSKIHSTYYFDGLLYYFWYNEKRQYAQCSGLTIECEYVHQLQNLYFAITGEELTPLH